MRLGGDWKQGAVSSKPITNLILTATVVYHYSMWWPTDIAYNRIIAWQRCMLNSHIYGPTLECVSCLLHMLVCIAVIT